MDALADAGQPKALKWLAQMDHPVGFLLVCPFGLFVV